MKEHHGLLAGVVRPRLLGKKDLFHRGGLPPAEDTEAQSGKKPGPVQPSDRMEAKFWGMSAESSDATGATVERLLRTLLFKGAPDSLCRGWTSECLLWL